MAIHKRKGRRARERRISQAKERARQRAYQIPPGGLEYWTMSPGRLVAWVEGERRSG